MLGVLQVVSVIFVVLAMVPALAHALELPGKMRLSKDAYFAVQPIYFPGFWVSVSLSFRRRQLVSYWRVEKVLL